MKIIKNTSIYDTAFIKKACVATHQHMAKIEGRLRTWNRLELDVGSRRSGYSGFAYYSGLHMRFSFSPMLSVTALIELAYHELMHCYGYRHKHGCDAAPSDVAGVLKLMRIDNPSMPIPEKQLASRKARNIIDERYKRMLTRRQTWGAKLRRAQIAYDKVSKEITVYKRRHGERVNGLS